MNIPLEKNTLLIFGLLVVFMMVLPATAANSLTITKIADPGTLFEYGSSCEPDMTTVTLSVTGYGTEIPEEGPVDIVFAIDSTGSMRQNDRKNIRLTGAQEFIDELTPATDQVGVVAWDHRIVFTYPSPPGLTSDFETAKARIGTITPLGMTNGEQAIQRSIDMLDANTRIGPSNKVIILLTDGIFNVGGRTPAQLDDEIAEAVAKGYTIYTVGLGSLFGFPGQTVDGPLLEYIATSTGGKYYYAEKAEDIPAIYADILTQIKVNTAPYDVNVVEVTLPHIVISTGSISPAPDSVVTNPDGTTTITWLDAGRRAGNPHGFLNETATFTASFGAGSSQTGTGIAVDAPSAVVNYKDAAGIPHQASIPQAFLTVNQCSYCVSGTVYEGAEGTAVLPGWTVNVTNATGHLVGTAVSGGNGQYTICGLKPGAYTVCEQLQPGFVNLTPLCVGITVTDTNKTVDFRNQRLLCITGTIFDGPE
ncbi:MAG TPA: VWA domain-containing protein, partial [Methanoregulaceae archaeon]|nr:VWA domain-containing protein [Methanoregulaceae archaeon]